MNEGYALRYLRQVMGWSFEVDNSETTWLRTMSDFKYDSYRDFLGGSRFPEALLNWLQQFAPEDRPTAYALLRHRLIFVSFAEIQHLVNRTFPVYARQVIATRVAAKSGTPKYLVWSQPTTRKLYEDTLARTLFIGLSDGARIDGFRRANAGAICNDQVALGYDISAEKWRDLHEELRQRTGDPEATFEVLFLVDDFIGSGKTLLRFEDGKWKGKLSKLAQSYAGHRRMFSSDCMIAIHHYTGTEQSITSLLTLLDEARQKGGPKTWFQNPILTSIDLIFDSKSAITPDTDLALTALVEKYYNPSIETKSIKVGGTNAKFGFASCGLPVILEHNTPNNSLALLWAESSITAPVPPHRMRPLFRRRQRHT